MVPRNNSFREQTSGSYLSDVVRENNATLFHLNGHTASYSQSKSF